LITVLFATHNGEKTLPIMLEAFCHLAIPEDGWEIIVVDNASSDQSANIIKSYSDKLPINYLYEQKPGKNNALNLGLSYAKGDLIVFTDDDIIPQQDWLIQLRKCVDTRQSYNIFGGAIHPVWPVEPHQELLKAIPLSVAFAVTDADRKEGEVSAGLIFGANMAVRRNIIDGQHDFDVTVGPKGNNYPMGSETEFTTRLAELGHKSWFCASARVGHIIRSNQLSFEWLLGRAFRYGRGRCLREGAIAEIDRKIFGMSLWMLRKMLEHSLKSYWHLFNRQRYFYLKEAWEASYYKGYLYQSYLLYK